MKLKIDDELKSQIDYLAQLVNTTPEQIVLAALQEYVQSKIQSLEVLRQLFK